MITRTEDEQVIIDYLLGIASDTEQDEIEQRCFRDAGYHEKILAIEADLNWEYLRGNLEGIEAECFERRLVASARRRRVYDSIKLFSEFAGEMIPSRFLALGRHFKPRRLSWFNWPAAFAAVVALMLAGGSWWMFPKQDSTPTLAAQVEGTQTMPHLPISLANPSAAAPTTIPSENASAGREQSQQLKPARNSPAKASLKKHRSVPPRIFALEFDVSTLVRGDDLLFIHLPPNVDRVHLQLKQIKAGSPKFRAVLKSTNGEALWSQEDLRPGRRGPVLSIPAGILRDGVYVLDLFGVDARNESIQIVQMIVKVARTTQH